MNEKDMANKKDPSLKLILIVDDDETLIDYMTTLLQGEGFRTKSACDGKIALQRVKEEKTDLILLDMMMPNAGGYEVIKELQGNPETRDIPVMVVTARKVDQTTWDMIKQEPNVKDIVIKPINPFQFRKIIHETLQTISPQDKRDREARKEQETKRSGNKWELPPAFQDRKIDK